MDARPRLLLSRIVLDVADMDRAAAFWCEALGYVVAARHEAFTSLKDPLGVRPFRIGFQPAEGPLPEDAVAHLEVWTDDMEREARRLEALGATRAKDWPYNDPHPNWIVMRDLDGHPFCVCQMAPADMDFS